VDQRIATLECGIEAPRFEEVCLETLQLPGIPLLEHIEMCTLGVVTEVAYGRVDDMAVLEQVDNDVARNETSGSRYADATHCGNKSTICCNCGYLRRFGSSKNSCRMIETQQRLLSQIS
jgi:hypothetical protein